MAASSLRGTFLSTGTILPFTFLPLKGIIGLLNIADLDLQSCPFPCFPDKFLDLFYFLITVTRPSLFDQLDHPTLKMLHLINKRKP